MSTTAELINSLASKITTLGEKSQGTDNGLLKALIERSVTDFEIPYGVTSIGASAFRDYSTLESITIPDSVTTIQNRAFRGCSSLTSVVFPSTKYQIAAEAFYQCTSLASVVFGIGVTEIGGTSFASCNNLDTVIINTEQQCKVSDAFANCTALKNVTLSKYITSFSASVFAGCTSLEFVTLEDGFNATGLNLSASQKLSVDTIVAMFTALADRTGTSAYRLTLNTVYGDLLSADQIAIATAKNWTIVFAG